MVRVGGHELAWREGMTIADVLDELGDPYPYAVARIGERIVTAPHFGGASIPDGAEIHLLPLVAGG
jgi:sulfur carrier protein ThiS